MAVYDNIAKWQRELYDYIISTYDEHYVAEDSYQTIDFIDSLGSADTFSRDTALKYLSRYGKKGGKNKKDLIKALHYIIILLEKDHGESTVQAEEPLA